MDGARKVVRAKFSASRSRIPGQAGRQEFMIEIFRGSTSGHTRWAGRVYSNRDEMPATPQFQRRATSGDSQAKRTERGYGKRVECSAARAGRDRNSGMARIA